MSDTISMDRAGRIVLPKPFRDRFRLRAGARFTLEIVGDHLALTPLREEGGSGLVEKNGLLVVPSSGEASDAVDALSADREEREGQLTGGD